MQQNLLKTMTLEELAEELEKQQDHPKRVELIAQEIARRKDTE